MKIQTTKESLLPSLLQAASVVERRQTLPILSNLFFKLDPGGLSITGTDMEVEIKTRVEVESGDEGEFTVPARKLVEICKALPAESRIVLDVETDKVTIRSGRGRFTLSTLPPADFPMLEVTAATHYLKIDQERLKRLLDKTAFAMALQDIRYYLNGMLLEGRPGRLRTVATDGHRLALCDVEMDSESVPELQVIIPRKAVLELNRLLDAGSDAPPLELQFSPGFMKVDFGHSSFATKLVEGRYPPYEKAIPRADTEDLVADRESLRQALTRTAVLSNEKYRGVRFHAEPGLLNLMTHNPEHEVAEEELEVDYQGKAMTLGFNVKYLLDVLGALEGERVRFGLIDPSSGCLITGEEGSGLEYVVMPMRI